MTRVTPPADSRLHTTYDAFGEVVCSRVESMDATAPVASGTTMAWAVSIAAFWGLVLVLVIARAALLAPGGEAQPPQVRPTAPSPGVAAPIRGASLGRRPATWSDLPLE